jgi:hypothetical protein
MLSMLGEGSLVEYYRRTMRSVKEDNLNPSLMEQEHW